MAYKLNMYKRAKNITPEIKLLLKLMVIMSSAILVSMVEAADQGKLGKSSSASVDISVTVKQTLNTISPNELLLNKKFASDSKKPFCVAHHGYKQNALVPYELIVESISTASSQNNKHALPFYVYLQNENVEDSKQQLIQGVSITAQSDLHINKTLQGACIDSGLQLSIEENNHEQNTTDTSLIGIMVLLISPT